MATVIVNNPVGSNVVYPGQYTTVWFKRYWFSVWRFAPFVFPEGSIEATAPSDSEATLEWNFGKYVNLWNLPGDTLLPINLNDWHVQIRVHTIYGTYSAWEGVVVGESMVEWGIDVNTGLPKGTQTIECRGLEYLLERRPVLGTYVGDATGYTYLPRTRKFNDTSARRESLAGNRAASINPDAGCYLFSRDGNKWSNYDIIRYLLATFVPWVPYGSVQGQVVYAPQFYLTGQTAGLRYIFQEHDLAGKNIRECLNELIPRKRGFGWKIQTDNAGRILIYVFSLAQFPVVGNGAFVPANPRQVDVPIHDDKHIQVQYRITSTSQVDEIVVESTTGIKTCATIRFSNGSLEPAWNPSLDAEMALTGTEESFITLAQDLYTNWVSVPGVTYFAFIGYAGFAAYSEGNANYDFITSGHSNPADLFAALLAAFNILDVDGDGKISKEDLLIFEAPETYQTATEEARATDKYATVFSHFQVPKNWGWEGWSPSVSAAGDVDVYGQGNFWNHDNAFERFLPFIEPGSARDAEPEYLEPFACIEFANREREILLALANDGLTPYTLSEAQDVDPTITESEFNNLANGFGLIDFPDILNGLANYPVRYFQLDRAGQYGMNACSLRMGDSGMRIIIKSQANHVFAKNHEEGGTFEIPPAWDYRTLIATVFVETDMMPRVQMRIYTNRYREADGSVVAQASPIGKTIYIQVPGKEVWMVAPLTVKALDGTDLVFFNDGEPGIVRDDTADLRFIAQLARVWYGQQRASVSMRIANQYPSLLTGDLVRSTVSGWSVEPVGTCVTAIMRDYQAGTHEVITGYGEMDPGAFAGEFR